jgi:hypothetical protein
MTVYDSTGHSHLLVLTSNGFYIGPIARAFLNNIPLFKLPILQDVDYSDLYAVNDFTSGNNQGVFVTKTMSSDAMTSDISTSIFTIDMKSAGNYAQGIAATLPTDFEAKEFCGDHYPEKFDQSQYADFASVKHISPFVNYDIQNIVDCTNGRPITDGISIAGWAKSNGGISAAPYKFFSAICNDGMLTAGCDFQELSTSLSAKTGVVVDSKHSIAVSCR